MAWFERLWHQGHKNVCEELCLDGAGGESTRGHSATECRCRQPMQDLLSQMYSDMSLAIFKKLHMILLKNK